MTPEITAEQALAAQNLISEITGFAPIIDLIPLLPDGLRTALRTAHASSDCVARSEGAWCCVDILLRDPDAYDPNTVAEARELLDNWQAQQPRITSAFPRHQGPAVPQP